MDEPIRFVACVVEHPRSNDAEFQVLNKAADQLLRSPAGAASEATLRFDVSEIPCLSCMGALRQFQKSFPRVRMRASFSIRKVMEVCEDCSHDIDRQLVIPPRQPTDLPKPTAEEVLENRGRGRPTVATPQAPNTLQRRHLRRPLGIPAAKELSAPQVERAKPYPSSARVFEPDPDTAAQEAPLSRPVSVYDQLKRRDWGRRTSARVNRRVPSGGKRLCRIDQAGYQSTQKQHAFVIVPSTQNSGTGCVLTQPQQIVVPIWSNYDWILWILLLRPILVP